MPNKIKSPEEIAKIAEKLREKGRVLVTTNGSFDILHAAHVRLLQKAKKQGDVLIVLLNSDSSIKHFKGEKRPILSQEDRSEILSSLKAVNYIVIFEEDAPLALIEKIKPHVHVKGGSFIQERIAQEKALLSQWNGQLMTFPLEEGYSTTNIIEKILKIFT